jgi:hypothetical protein
MYAFKYTETPLKAKLKKARYSCRFYWSLTVIAKCFLSSEKIHRDPEEAWLWLKICLEQYKLSRIH